MRYIIQFFKKLIGLSTWHKTLLALVSGVILGLVLREKTIIFKPLGDIFINAIHMMVVPVIATVIVNAVLNLGDLEHRMAFITGKAFLIYAISMIVASVVALCMAYLIQPGVGVMPDAGVKVTTHIPTLAQTLVNAVPPSPVQAFAENNVLQVLVFSLLVGASILRAKDKAAPVADFFRAFYRVVFHLVEIIMSFAPIGIAALLAIAVGTAGSTTLWHIVKFVLVVYLSCILYCVIFYSPVLLIITRTNPLQFFRKIYNPAILSFATSSSAATLPVSIECAEQDLKINKSLAAFLLPLGSSFNLNGLSIYLSVAVVFAANLYNVHLTLWHYTTIVMTILMTAMGAAAVPGTGLVIMGVIMTAVGLPLGALPLIAGVDRLNDMAQTSVNVMGDLFACYIVDKTSLSNNNNHNNTESSAQ